MKNRAHPAALAPAARLLLGLAATSKSPLLPLASAEDFGTCFNSASGFSKDVWSHCQSVAPGIYMYYTPANEDGNVLLGLHAPSHSEGWSSLALAGNGGMKGASQIVVRKAKEDNGSSEDMVWVAEDRYSDAYATPSMDDSQDVKLLFARQDEEDGTSWGVALRADSCDEQDYPVVDRSVWMHWALGSSHDFGFHGGNRGQFHANLMQPPSSSSADIPLEPRSANGGDANVEALEAVDVLMPNVDVVMGDGGSDPTNPYICSFFDMDELKREHEVETGHQAQDDKVHIVSFSPVVDSVSKDYVHHMILYACDEASAQNGGYAHEKIVPECGSMPAGCDEMMWPWAIGSANTVMPSNVGIPVGGENGSRWLVLQMHYYNPSLDEGVKDSSGVRVQFTPQLREHDAGYLQLSGGTGSFQRDPMPAGVSSHVLTPTFVVPSSCTSSWEEPLNVIGVGHHQHQVGKKISIEVQRNGQNLGPMRIERQFDFNHHSMEESAIPQLLPGDEFVVNCEYDTSSRTEDVEFGEGSQDEMCYGFVMYYPVQAEHDIFAYFPASEEVKAAYETACSSPGTDQFSEVSLCAQSYVQDVPTFLQLDMEMPSFGALDLCNSPLYETMLEPHFPGTCPPCSQNDNCTDTAVLAWGQEVLCPRMCNEFGGLTLWPDTSVTEASASQGVWCGGDGITYFAPNIADAEECQAKGDLNVPSLEVQGPAENSAQTLSLGGAGIALAAVIAFLM
eukprot:CAMPEP_0197466362 /NCGR_PEP_ID=MMETSP1175-20131217/65009_1 /TAXON_ID=1003142 /ORGANISM="Triceratium dubium, Strain CCMP147" /LENGTH=732 /DNA_ID=CAMNT_0043002397 /DNA_START=129 /DNA_END=2327 /DNA_ORIENTATION=+